MSARWKQYQKATSTRSILMFALIVALAPMYAPSRLFILNSLGLQLRNKGCPWAAFFVYLNFTFLNLKELVITDTELKLIASAAIIGESSIPKKGYKIPAAIGIPSVL